MDSFKILLEYIKSEILKVTNDINVIQLESTLQVLEMNLDSFNKGIDLVSKDLILDILKENLPEDMAIQNYELFLETITLKEYLNTNIQIPQIKICLDLLDSIKTYINNKIGILKQELIEIKEKNNRELEIYNKYISYFDKNQLKRNLNKDELDELLNFIMDSSLDENIKTTLFIQIGVNQIRLFETKNLEQQHNNLDVVRRNAARIKLLKEQVIENQEETIEEVEILPQVNLTDEEKQIYDKIINISEILKNEKMNLEIEKSFIDLIDVNDFTLFQVRKELYETPGINPFALMYLDLNHNLINNFYNHKEEIIQIFKYFIDIFDSKFITRQSYKESLPLLSSNEIIKIEKYIIEYNNLNESQKNTIINNEENYNDVSREDYDSLCLELTYEQFKYYLTIKKLIIFYEKYNNILSEDVKNDKNNANLNIIQINSIKKSIAELVNSLDVMKNLSSQEEEFIETEEVETKTNSNHVNLPILFPSRLKSISENAADIIEELRKNYREKADLFLSQNIEDLSELLLVYPIGEIKKRAKKGNRSHSFNSVLTDKRGYCPLFDDYTVFKYKHDVATASRLSYMMLHINEKNKLRLQQEFKIEDLNNICLVLNFDASVLAEKEYVNRTHSILKRDLDYINHIIDLFKNEFKTEDDYKEAVELINESIKELNSLKENYYQSERSI